jgi:hypothetical protein
MIRKLLCWLGLHKWEHTVYMMCNGFEKQGNYFLPKLKMSVSAFCKYCGKEKR